MPTLTWEQVAFAAGRGDGDLGAAVRQAYREAGLAEPERLVVLASPAAGALAAARLTEADAGASVRDAVRTRPWERARAEAYAELGASGWAVHWGETGGRLWPRVDRLVGDIRRAIATLGATDPTGDGPREGVPGGAGMAVFGGLSPQVSDGEALRRVTLDAVLGQHDAPWLSAFDGLDGLKRVAECAGWWWPYERLAIVTERPVEVHLDDLGRLHRADGPALLYADGFALHAWHGMPVPAGFGAELGEVTPERIRAESNAELRRVMLEHFGLERYLAESGAQPVHSDETGVLWRIELPGDEPLAMVEVVNSTPEPDGTSRTYFLRVPPWVERARQGVAWTFGVGEEDYHPQRET
ncbi:hypothetical protein SAMN05444920_103456 [Nonomuraea solani]|uniref:DUF6745 domain-containing protein n=1 Tax=Nonomuraea solani TaxID=1144553 RepID=A0A1H6BL51_9ACTN|nr:hypothetical protein [Nonomuraea solani]SEG61107.1 hypothetical protein SAMN05444920_103456 [Nonomuraea solani]